MILDFFVKLIGKPIIIFLTLLILFGILAQLILSHQLAESSRTLSQILKEAEFLERKNRDLAIQIHQKGSILRLKELAQNFGFGRPQKFFFVRQNFLVAQKTEVN